MRGATVVVRRAGRYLVLRRVEFHDNGDWEWTPPAGASEPGEAAYHTAVRELREETGLQLPLTLVRDGDWADDACARCTPLLVADQLRGVA